MTVIPGLRDSLTYQVSAELYQRHRDAGNGACAACGDSAPCPSRRHATSVIVAAGEDPRFYDVPAVPVAGDPQPAQGQREDRPELAAPTYTGYQLGGRGHRASPQGYFHDRDSS
jgi:hypothetical protein